MHGSAERSSVSKRRPPFRPPPSSNTFPLTEALELVLLLRDHDSARYPKAALRWHSRLSRELPGLTLAEAAAILALLEAIGEDTDRGAARALAELLRGLELDPPARILTRWAKGSATG